VRTYLTTKADIYNPPDLNISIPIDICPNNQIEASLIGVNYVLGTHQSSNLFNDLILYPVLYKINFFYLFEVTSPIPTNTEGL
jgi:hypothetical protein